MTKQEASLFLSHYLEKKSAYECALSIMYFDQCTVAPKDGATYRNKCSAILSGELFSHMVDETHIKKLEEMANMEDLEELDKINVQLLRKDLEELRYLPKEFYVEFQNTTSNAFSAWEEARRKNDYSIFEPYLKKVIEMKKRSFTYMPMQTTPYEVLLNRYQPGMSMEAYDHFFDVIKEQLLPFIKRIQEEGTPIDDEVLHQYYDPKVQEQVMHLLQEYMCYDADKIYMGVTTHPFTSKICANDTRLSTAYLEDNLVSSIFSIIHEYGHALYGMQVNEKYDGTPAGENLSLGMHESQSRMLENCIAKEPAFWVNNYPKVQALFPNQLKDVSLEQFMAMLHVSKPSFIRTEADELTYPIHVLIRYELEKKIFNEDLPLDHLDEVWADYYEAYLGIRPTNASEGILQDMHWADGMFGYFPTYALGSAFAAQFYHQMKQDIDVNKALSNHNFHIIMDWLKKHIHSYGATKSADEILMHTTHETFNPNYYIEYLISKYSRYYRIK